MENNSNRTHLDQLSHVMRLKPKFLLSAFSLQLLFACLLSAGLFFAAGCSKSDPEKPQIEDPKSDDSSDEPDDEPESAGNFYKLIRVENLTAGEVRADGGGSGDAPADHNRNPSYFSLEQNKVYTDTKYAKTSRWDITFFGTNSSAISANNGANANNPGYGNRAGGGIAIVEKHFDEVTEVPEDITFKTGASGIGLDAYGDYGDGVGWLLYDFGGEKVGREAHIAYALGEGLTLANGTAVPPRTLIVRTANEHHAKIKMISNYKDAFTIDKWLRSASSGYFTFEYIMIPKGEKAFKIKNDSDQSN